MQASLTARPLQKLSVNTNLRFEDRDDNTPVLFYNPMATFLDLNENTWNGLNNPRSFRTITGKFEANYALPHSFRLIGSIDYDHRDRTGTCLLYTSALESTFPSLYVITSVMAAIGILHWMDISNTEKFNS